MAHPYPEAGQFLIGRKLDCDIVLDDETVSRRHAELVVVEPGHYVVRDLGSSHGTYANADGDWVRTNEAHLRLHDPVRLGLFKATPHLLLLKLRNASEPQRPPSQVKVDSGGIRSLRAVMAADVVGYSKFMGQNEEATLAAFNYVLQQVLGPCVAEHEGRIFKLIGDGVMVEFASVVKAVNCALRVQTTLSGLALSRQLDPPIIFRIGVNLGDVISDGQDLYGDGVNIAARLEGLANPGGICISGAVYEQIRNKLYLGYESLGAREMKNIDTPIQVYRVFSTETGTVIPS